METCCELLLSHSLDGPRQGGHPGKQTIQAQGDESRSREMAMEAEIREPMETLFPGAARTWIWLTAKGRERNQESLQIRMNNVQKRPGTTTRQENTKEGPV